MQKNILTKGLLALSAVAVIVPAVASADHHGGERKEMRAENMAERKEMHAENKAERAEFREEMKGATPEERAERKEERKEMMQENREEYREMRAEQKEERMEMRKEGRMEATEKRAERFAANYARATERLSNVIERLNEAGADTSELSGMVDTLDQKAADVASAYEAYETAQGGDDKDAITDARAALVSARDDFRSYYKDTLRPAVVALVEVIKSTGTNEE